MYLFIKIDKLFNNFMEFEIIIIYNKNIIIKVC